MNKINSDLIDDLLKDYRKPEDIIGENGILKQLTKAVLELRAFVFLYPDAQNILESVHTDANRQIDGFVNNTPLVTYLHPDRIEKHYGIDLVKRAVLPFFYFGQYPIGH